MYVSDDQRDQERKMDNSFNIHSFTKAPISSHFKIGSVPSPGFEWSSGQGRALAFEDLTGESVSREQSRCSGSGTKEHKHCVYQNFIPFRTRSSLILWTYHILFLALLLIFKVSSLRLCIPCHLSFPYHSQEKFSLFRDSVMGLGTLG